MSPFLIVLVGVAFLGASFAGVFWLLVWRPRPEAPSAAWLDEFSIQSYAPMERLLDTADIAFLASQPGYRPEIGKRLTRERREIFKSYLQHLAQDFQHLIAIGKLMLVYAAEDRPELARALLRQQATFQWRVGLVRLQLAIYPLGLSRPEVRALVQSVEAIRLQIQQQAIQRAALNPSI